MILKPALSFGLSGSPKFTCQLLEANQSMYDSGRHCLASHLLSLLPCQMQLRWTTTLWAQSHTDNISPSRAWYVFCLGTFSKVSGELSSNPQAQAGNAGEGTLQPTQIGVGGRVQASLPFWTILGETLCPSQSCLCTQCPVASSMVSLC